MPSFSPQKVNQARVSLLIPELDFERNLRETIAKKVDPRDNVPPLLLMSRSWLHAFHFCLHIFFQSQTSLSLSLSSTSFSFSFSLPSCPASSIYPVLSPCPFMTMESDCITWVLRLLRFSHPWAPWRTQWTQCSGIAVFFCMEEGSQGLLNLLRAAHGRSYRSTPRFTTKKERGKTKGTWTLAD